MPGRLRQVTAVNGVAVSAVETPVFLRALGIYLVIVSHYGLGMFEGNPVLMVVSGLSFAKFQLRTIAKERSILPVVRFSWRIALPAIIDTITRQVAHHSFDLKSLFLIDNLLEPHPFGAHESPYYIDMLIQCLLIASIPLAVPAIRRFAVAKPLQYGMLGLLASWLVSILVRYSSTGPTSGPPCRSRICGCWRWDGARRTAPRGARGSCSPARSCA